MALNDANSYPPRGVPHGPDAFFEMFDDLEPGKEVDIPNDVKGKVRLGLSGIREPKSIKLRKGEDKMNAVITAELEIEEPGRVGPVVVALSQVELDNHSTVMCIEPHQTRDWEILEAVVALADVAKIARDEGFFHQAA